MLLPTKALMRVCHDCLLNLDVPTIFTGCLAVPMKDKRSGLGVSQWLSLLTTLISAPIILSYCVCKACWMIKAFTLSARKHVTFFKDQATVPPTRLQDPRKLNVLSLRTRSVTESLSPWRIMRCCGSSFIVHELCVVLHSLAPKEASRPDGLQISSYGVHKRRVLEKQISPRVIGQACRAGGPLLTS